MFSMILITESGLFIPNAFMIIKICFFSSLNRKMASNIQKHTVIDTY